MATLLTHGIVAAALVSAAPKALPRKRLAFALVVVSILPDIDVAAFALGIPYAHPLGHRGFTHSLCFALVVAWSVARFEFRSLARYNRTWWQLFTLLAVATASHGALDAMTNGGLGIGFFLPFEGGRYFFPARPLVVSPIGVDAFARGPALAILKSEALFVWAPVAAALAIRALAQLRAGTGPK